LPDIIASNAVYKSLKQQQSIANAINTKHGVVRYYY